MSRVSTHPDFFPPSVLQAFLQHTVATPEHGRKQPKPLLTLAGSTLEMGSFMLEEEQLHREDCT